MSSPNHITIVSTPSENKSENFDFLLDEGITLLQDLVGKIWTDFNVHDPGVTILEQLCYAITDLGYRTNLDIKDLLAVNESDPTEKDLNNFFTARQILTNAAFTVNDYRKLLIDLEGVKNAWFEKTTDAEVDFYANFTDKKITYDPETDNTRIALNGLYEVLIEFDYSEEFGDLNDNTIISELEITEGDLKGLQLEITVEFPYWDYVWSSGKSWDSLADIKGSISSILIDVEEEVSGYKIAVEVLPDNSIDVSVSDTTGAGILDMPTLAAELKATIDLLFDETNSDVENILLIQQAKVAETKAIIDLVKATVQANRNLCEDFVRFSALKVEEIVLCADIELTSDANSEAVLAEIYYLVGQFLAPDIHFYSVAEMRELGKSTEEIFDGPRLENGFIDTDELEASTIKKSIHVSDLINIIMDVEGVIAIKEIKIGNIPLGDSTILSKSVFWCLDLAWDKNFVPRLSREKSKITLIKKGIPFIADEDEVEDLIAEKIAAAKSQTKAEEPYDLPVPNGNYYQLDDYTSIQNGFPENYGIGEVGLPGNASDQRKAQANQLKAYLLFYDQFLANFCSQLKHLKMLFSMNSDIDQTYFHQSLFDIPNVANLYKEYVRSGKFTNDPAKDGKVKAKEAWACFTSLDEDPNAACQDFSLVPPLKSQKETLTGILEDQNTFEKRRNLFLDHLLSRFAEQFSDYAMLAYKMDGAKAAQELIDDKLAFLQEYPDLSYNRGQAFNYLMPAWDNNNVSGLQKRVSRLLGIDNYAQRDLACPPVINFFNKYKDTDNKWRFRFKNQTGDILLKSEAYNSNAARTVGINSVMLNGTSYQNYKILEASDGTFYYNLVAQNGEIIGTSNLYLTEDERSADLDQLVTILRGQCSGEGFYLLEHILLRPRALNEDDFLPVSFQEDCFCSGNEDAYSFRATCVMPYWIGRFTNMDFRNFVERTIREETPAHIFMKICWINPEQMAAFQTAYKAWLAEMEICPPNQLQLTEKQNDLIAVLNSLRNVYPVANLYDCRESGTSPIKLGQSILGTFIPNENE